jgi:uncharacterized YigZ family protein
MEAYTTIEKRGSYEYEDRKSVFIGEAAPVSTEAEALASIESVKKHYPDARHHVYAYTLRDGFTTRFSDDREPQGTAGMPVLDVIRKNGCTDTVIVVTRYFGGTLLGTGGLVKAYTEAALGALKDANIIKYDVYSVFDITVSYSDHGKISSVLSELSFRTEDVSYREEVTVSGKIIKSNELIFEKKLMDSTSGRAKIEKIDEKFDF